MKSLAVALLSLLGIALLARGAGSADPGYAAPGSFTVRQIDDTWVDDARNRYVPVRIRLPESGERVPTIVIDASVAVWAVLPVVAASDVTAQFAEWRKHGSRIVAPDHWVAECVSAIRRTVYRRIVSDAEGRVAIQDLFALDVEIVPTTERQYLWCAG